MNLDREPLFDYKEVKAMTAIHRRYGYFSLGIILALISGLILFVSIQTAQAQRPGPEHGFGPGPRSGPDPHQKQFHDSRYHHDRSYPTRGQVIRALPRDHRVVVHGGTRYYFSGGAWYRPQGPRFAVIVPPIGLFVPFLPPYYSTVWLGGVPYYYANEVYYAHRGNGYVVVEPPKEEVSQAPPPVDQMFIYPRMGQDEKQQADDRFACHQWAVNQTGFDPTLPPGVSPEPLKIEKRADYQRAMGACLDGRGYTVK
jgi:hypothetical protein